MVPTNPHARTAAAAALLAAGALTAVAPASSAATSPPAAVGTTSAQAAALTATLDELHLRTLQQAAPAACAANRLLVQASQATPGQNGATIALQVSTSGQACSLTDYPTVRLHLADGTDPVAKEFGYLPASQAGLSALTAYQDNGTARAVLVVQPGTWTQVTLVAPESDGAACQSADSATVYPTNIALGAGKTVSLPDPVTVCGAPRALPYQTSAPTAVSMAGRALASVGPTAIHPDNDSPSGFWYGSDGPNGGACGSAPYTECHTTGAYGGYVGEVGLWDQWQGCGAGNDFQNTSAGDALVNYESYNKGVGTQGYWMLGGPGRKTNSSISDTTWGAEQAQQAANFVSDSIYLIPGVTAGPYIYADLELYSGPNSEFNNGWNSTFSSVCQTGAGNGSWSATNNRDVYNGFYNFLDDNTVGYPGIYNEGQAPGSGQSWNVIMGGGTLGNSAEWTWTPGSNSGSIATFPQDWSVPGGNSAVFFANPPSKCETAWQWSGGGGVGNSLGVRFDQFDGNNFPANSSSPCE